MINQNFPSLHRLNIRVSLIAIIFCILCFSCTNKDRLFTGNDKLWYTYPAKYWNSQALHLGNGYFGASLFGGVEQEVLTLTEASMWTGGPANGNWEKAGVNPKANKTLPLIRELIIQGNSRYADSLLTNNFFGSSELFGNFTTVGDLKINFLNHTTQPEEYKRSLDLANSLATVQYKINNSSYKREYFCSYPDRILGMKFTSDRPADISFDLFMDVMQDSSVIEISENKYCVKGFITENLRPFQMLIYIRNNGGKTEPENEKLSVRDADSVELYLTIATDYQMKYPDYKGNEPGKVTDSIIQKIVNWDFNQLKSRHIADYKSLYDRVTLNIKGNKATEKLPTNERFQRLTSGGADPGYKVLAFNLGRYMIISSSRQNTLPANLQGVWNAFRVAPWAGNYQSNINLQEIYWSCGPANLIECQQAYINWIENLAVSGREVARRVYGTNGWVSHTTGNIWGHAAPIGSHPWAMFPMGAAWHCQHVWDQYAFTQDREYLQKQAYPLLKDAAIFWLENLVPFKGFLISAPSVSAEHGALMTENGLNPSYHDFESNKYRYSLPGVYQDIEMLWDLFTNTSEAARILGDSVFADSLLITREKLLPLKTGKYGQLQEWYNDIDNPDCHHRHIAHLYAVCPGKQIHPTTTPDLAEAAKKSLDMRGDDRFPEQELVSGGNWARAHRMWCWTRLMDGNRANKILTEMLTEEGFENGLTFQHINYHWGRTDFYKEGDLYCHFQLDGSASVPGCIAEMLLQSHLNTLHLLPALPDEFNTGKIKGIKARGGYTVDMEWKNGQLVWANIYAKKGSPLPIVRLKDKIINSEDFKEIKIIAADLNNSY
jgi:alpha-L-fucosidase 2